MFRSEGLFVEQGIIGGQGIGELQGSDGFEDLGVRIEREFPVVGRMLSQVFEVFGCCCAYPSPPVGVGIQQEGTGLERGEPPFRIQPLCALRCGCPGRPATALVDSHTVSQVAAQKHVYGYVGCFAADVPQRVFDAGYGGQPGAARGKTELLVGLHHQVFDSAGIFTHEPRGDIVNNGFDGEVRPDGIGFAPSVEALVGFHLDERPGSVAVSNEKRLDRGDFHGVTSPYAGDSLSCVWFRFVLEEIAGRAIQRLAERFDGGQIDPSGPVVEDGGYGVGLKPRQPGDFRDSVRPVRTLFGHENMELKFQHTVSRLRNASSSGRPECRRPNID